MKILRLLITKDCNRDCEGCCNKGWDLNALPVISDYTGYDTIILTGGEPMLHVEKILETIANIKMQTDAPIILYTADVSNLEDAICILYFIDGLTLTLHTQDDVAKFNVYDDELDMHNWEEFVSFRLNIFKGVTIEKDLYNKRWKIKENMEWIPNCSLPDGEVFGRVADI